MSMPALDDLRVAHREACEVLAERCQILLRIEGPDEAQTLQRRVNRVRSWWVHRVHQERAHKPQACVRP